MDKELVQQFQQLAHRLGTLTFQCEQIKSEMARINVVLLQQEQEAQKSAEFKKSLEV